MNERFVANLVDGFLLHARPYRDSSVIAEFFTVKYGRVAVVARGVRRPKSRLRGLLQPFRPVLVSWISRGNLGTLTGLERGRSGGAILANRLLSAYYVNELVLRSLRPGDSQPEVFELYTECLEAMCGAAPVASILRCFERDLLHMLGYGLHLTADVNGKPIDRHANYQFDILAGARESDADAGAYSGMSLLALARGEFTDRGQLGDAKRLLRSALDHHLGGDNSRVRKVMSSMSSQRRRWLASSKIAP